MGQMHARVSPTLLKQALTRTRATELVPRIDRILTVSAVSAVLFGVIWYSVRPPCCDILSVELTG